MFYAGPSTSIRSVVRAYRRNPTEAERILWAALRGRKLRDLRFRRQHPIAGYIVDFYCASKKLVIELEGDDHFLNEEAIQADRKRDGLLIKKHSLKILRFLNCDVMRNFDGVCEEIERGLR